MQPSEDVVAVSPGVPEIEPEIESDETALSFGEHLLFPRRRQLLLGAQPVELGAKAFDTLLVLVEAEGRLVSKDELLRRVWPDTVVNDANVTAQISLLRKALGNGWDLVKTDTGRGYRFTGEVRKIANAADAIPKLSHIRTLTEATTNLPTPLSSLVGREQNLKALLHRVTTQRLVTLVGPGGIGKTQLALRAARLALADFTDGAWLVELDALGDAELIPHAVARVLGIPSRANHNLLDQIVAGLRGKRLLLVVDNCEHLVAPVAEIIERLLRGVPELHVLATSREALVAEGEQLYPVRPLSFPATDISDVSAGLEHSAVQLFAERARAANPLFVLDDRSMPGVAKICRRLDGLPLAIELAAATVTKIGVEMLARRLDDRFRLLTGGRRTALRRHQTLSAVFDWGFELLSLAEQTVLRRIAIFAGSFSLESGGFVAAGDGLDAAQATDIVMQLVQKSLVTFDVRRSMARYRLLDTTRGYALAKLRESGEFPAVARRHADHLRELLEGAQQGWQTTPVAELIARYAPEVDNIRVALEWAFDGDGDAEIGVSLAAAAVPLWTLLSILGECRDLVDRALRHLAQGPKRQTRQEMLLQAALARSAMWAKGAVSEAGSANARALDLAESLGDPEYQLTALYNLWIYRLRTGELRTSLAVAERFRSVAETKGDLAAVRTGARMEGVSLFHLGEYDRSHTALQSVIDDHDANLRRSYVVRFGLDQRVSALTCLARVLWVQGFPERALRAAEASVAEARRADHVNSLCIALCFGACGLATMAGEPRAVEEYVPILTEDAAKHGLGMWQVDSMALKGWLAIQRGETAAGLELLTTALAEFKLGRLGLHQPIFVGALAEALGAVGRAEDGLTVIEDAIAEATRNEANWCLPELLRIRGELLRRALGDASLAAEKDFRDSLALARRQGAKSWALRTATSLARLRQAQGRDAEARAQLRPIYEAFSEGLDSVDLRAAQALLATLRESS
jgi:predicted ATPase/DNA-binding winged helix-turn-helix (wHTH) protein